MDDFRAESTLGERIRRLRTGALMTQDDLAAAAGVSTVSRGYQRVPERLSVGAELSDGRWSGQLRIMWRCLDLSTVAGI
jgi:transcriptional regulator with XRE-family HTH domain